MKPPITAKNARFIFYDVESLSNVFTVAHYEPKRNELGIFFLVEKDSDMIGLIRMPESQSELKYKIFATNPALPTETKIFFYPLHEFEHVERLASTFGVYQGGGVNNPESEDFFRNTYRPVCDTSPEYDPIGKHPYLVGYNSYNYDSTIMAMFFHESLNNVYMDGEDKTFIPTTPQIMREHNNDMFFNYKINMSDYLRDAEPARLIRQGFIASGRHIDVARLNETQMRVGLKRLLGGMGRQILESDKLSHNAKISGFADFCELVAYNVSDVVGLAKLFEQPVYANAFDLKKSLLDKYPETIYMQGGEHSRQRVRYNRLTPDSTSARFVATILAPYVPLQDDPVVSFVYPHPEVAKQLGIEPVNVLDDSLKFFRENIDCTTLTGKEAYQSFEKIINYYKQIENKNFNTELNNAYSLASIKKENGNIPYFYRDGGSSGCFVKFSTGGIHGAEYDANSYMRANLAVYNHNAALAEIRMSYPNPFDFWIAHPPAKPFVAKNGVSLSRSQVLKPGSDRATLIDPENNRAGYRDDKPRPALFKVNPSGDTSLAKEFVYTSLTPVIHEDFTSYYPSLLINMRAFHNPDSQEDRYAKIFADKDYYSEQLKRIDLSDEERSRISALRNGTKLILNSASGVADTIYPNNIRMNNRIIAMRIIGQLFSWRVGQAQTLAGARIVSTNTDGLYSVLDEETNNRILTEQTRSMGIRIEPERLWLVSKDSNNRLELAIPAPGERLSTTKIVSASGSSLAAHNGPLLTKSLAHPAVLDWVLVRYLRAIVAKGVVDGVPLTLDSPFNLTGGMLFMAEAFKLEPIFVARLFQNILVASVGKITYPFATEFLASDFTNPLTEGSVYHPGTFSASGGSRVLQHYNRMFFVKPGTPGAVSIQAAGSWVVSPATRKKREANRVNGFGMRLVDQTAYQILLGNGWSDDGANGTEVLPSDQDVACRKVPRVDPGYPVIIDNRDLVELSPETIWSDILSKLDLRVYLQILAESFTKNWMNQSKPEEI